MVQKRYSQISGTGLNAQREAAKLGKAALQDSLARSRSEVCQQLFLSKRFDLG